MRTPAKPGQTRVLAVVISREGFERALEHSCGSTPAADEDYDAWRRRKDASPVRIQWDPERDLHLNRLEHRSIQVGLGPEAVDRYVNDRITAITDATESARAIATHLAQDDIGTARTLLPAERPYPLEAAVAARIGATTAVP